MLRKECYFAKSLVNREFSEFFVAKKLTLPSELAGHCKRAYRRLQNRDPFCLVVRFFAVNLWCRCKKEATTLRMQL
jgi:hypothetical protein